jgi:hypothetical protein
MMPKVEALKIVTVKRILLTLMLLVLSHTLFAQRKPYGRVSNTRLIGSVKKVADSCGCYFRSANEHGNSERYVFFEDGTKGLVLMNIGGQNVRLSLVSSTEPPGGVSRNRERFSRRYASGDIRIRMDFVATSVCPGPYDPECVGNSYEVKLTAIKGSQKQTIKAVGGCGC